MKINKFGQVVVEESDIFRGLYSGQISDLTSINIGDQHLVSEFNSAKQKNADPFPELTAFTDPETSIANFDKTNQNNWFMPDKYKDFPIAEWLLEQCKTKEEEARVCLELELFVQHNMIDVLKYLKYLVDTMRQNQVLWGVGRGSSVASYCLFLLGVHKIDSIKYDLDIHEFLK